MVPLRSGGYRPNAVERKVNDVNIATYNINTTGSVTLLANPAVGANFNDRIGRKITLRSLFLRGKLYIQNSAGTPPANQFSPSQLARCIIVYDCQPNGVALTLAELLVTADSTAQLNLDNRDRFKILWDKVWTLGPLQTDASSFIQAVDRANYPIKKYKKLNLDMIFNGGSTGTVADITTGALYMVWIGDLGVGTTDCVFRGTTRVRYSDH